MITREKVTFSRHAISRIADMLLKPEEVRDCLEQPDTVMPSSKYKGEFNYRKGRLSLAVAKREDGSLYVVTAVWATREAWEADCALAPYPDDRAPRFYSDEQARKDKNLAEAKAALGG